MTAASHKKEPSMDDTLKSIRKMIAADMAADDAPNKILKQEPLPSKENKKNKDDVLLLTEVLNDDDKVVSFKNYQSKDCKISNTKISQKATEEPLLSQDVIKQTFASLGNIKKLLKTPSKEKAPNLNQTTEELICHLLRPLLKEWLEINLPAIIKLIVSEEVRKVITDYKKQQED